MDLSIILFSTGLLGLIWGTIQDFKMHEVADWVNYGLIFSGLTLRIMDSILASSIKPIQDGLIGFVLCFILGVLMFYTGQWGGGDSKMLMGLGAIFATYPAFLNNHFKPLFGQIPFLATLLINIIIIGGIYGIVWTVLLIAIHFKKFKPAFKEKIKESKKKKRYFLIASLLLIILSFTLLMFQEIAFAKFFIIMSILNWMTFYLFMVIQSIEKTCMCKNVHPDKLTIGDWIVNDIRIENHNKLTFAEYIFNDYKETGGKKQKSLILERITFEILKGLHHKKIILNKTSFKKKNKKQYKEIKTSIKENKFQDDIKHYIDEQYGYDTDNNKIRVTGPSDLGIEKFQIEILKEAYQKKKIKEIEIKEGIPFVPSFLIAFIVTIIIGNPLLYLF